MSTKRKVGVIISFIVWAPVNLISYPIFKMCHPKIAREWYPNGFTEYIEQNVKAIKADWRWACQRKAR